MDFNLGIGPKNHSTRNTENFDVNMITRQLTLINILAYMSHSPTPEAKKPGGFSFLFTK